MGPPKKKVVAAATARTRSGKVTAQPAKAGRPAKKTAAKVNKTPAPSSPTPQPSTATNKPTASTNAKDIEGMKSQLSDIGTILSLMREDQVKSNMAANQGEEGHRQQAMRSGSHLESQHVSASNKAPTASTTAKLHKKRPVVHVSDDDSASDMSLNFDISSPVLQGQGHGRHRGRHMSADPYAAPFTAHSSTSRKRHATSTLHTFPESADDMREGHEVRNQVAQLLAANLGPVPQASIGKRTFAYMHIVRGKKRAKANLGELNESEYNWGFLQCIFSDKNTEQERKWMVRHLEEVNEDAMTYEWHDVREWSEEVASRVASSDDRLTWGHTYQIDNLRSGRGQAVVQERERMRHHTRYPQR